MARKPKPTPKPRHRVKWPAEQWGANARVEIDVVLHQDNKPQSDPPKIHITTTQDHRTGDHPQREAKPKPLALTPEQLAASNANLAAIRDGVKKAAAGEKLEVTPEPEPETPEDLGVKQPPEELPNADARPHLTQAEIRALIQPKDNEEDWFEAVEAVCEKIGVFGACRWFFRVAGGGAGVVTVYWMVSKMLSQ